MDEILSFDPFSTDSLFLIGQQPTGRKHVCQDYARTGVIGSDQPQAYAIVSDGCGSAPDSDLGARLLTLWAEEHMHVLIDHAHRNELDIARWRAWGDMVFDAAEHQLRAFRRVSKIGLYATLIVALVGIETYQVTIFGDGGLATVDRQKRISTHRIEYSKNAPHYLAYSNPADIAHYRNNLGGKATLISVFDDKIDDPVRHGPNVVDLHRFTGRTEEIDALVLSTDGSDSFWNGAIMMPGASVLSQMASFKSSDGEFIKRRIYRIVREMNKAGFRHEDDLGVAGIAINRV